MFKKTAIAAGLGLALSATAQADYQWELEAGYTRGNFDYETKNPKTVDDDNDVDIFDVSGTWYLERVDTSKGPLGEAEFLDHASFHPCSSFEIRRIDLKLKFEMIVSRVEKDTGRRPDFPGRESLFFLPE